MLPRRCVVSSMILVSTPGIVNIGAHFLSLARLNQLDPFAIMGARTSCIGFLVSISLSLCGTMCCKIGSAAIGLCHRYHCKSTSLIIFLSGM